mmetsp:Transcript_21976/g.46725  ORF Transcript_21976/g.46725 Transcript_21976/m.46725 type:complete len:91 (-) Transcript_21976:120-392(-)
MMRTRSPLAAALVVAGLLCLAGHLKGASQPATFVLGLPAAASGEQLMASKSIANVDIEAYDPLLDDAAVPWYDASSQQAPRGGNCGFCMG